MDTVIIKDAKVVDIKKDFTGLWCATATDSKKWLPLNKFSKQKDAMLNILQELQKGQLISLIVNNKGFVDEIILSGATIVEPQPIKQQEQEPIQIIEENTPKYSSFDQSSSNELVLPPITPLNIPGIDEMTTYPTFEMPSEPTITPTANNLQKQQQSASDVISKPQVKNQQELLNIDQIQQQVGIENYIYNGSILDDYANIVNRPDMQVKIMDSCINRAIKIITTSDMASDMPSSYMSFVISKYALKTVEEVKEKIMEEVKSLSQKLFEFQTQEVINYLKQFEHNN